jgi:hypothetical protein
MQGRTGWYQSEGVVLTVADAKREILSKLAHSTREQIEKADALYVHIVDVQIGKALSRKDPWGLEWAVHDPLARVGFFNPKDVDESGQPTRRIQRLNQQKFPQIYLPASTHTRTLWCYLKSEGEASCHWREQLELAIAQWVRDRDLTEQHGASNTVSPAVHRGARAGATPTGGDSGHGRAVMRPAGLVGRFADRGRALSAIPEASGSVSGARSVDE